MKNWFKTPEEARRARARAKVEKAIQQTRERYPAMPDPIFNRKPVQL